MAKIVCRAHCLAHVKHTHEAESCGLGEIFFDGVGWCLGSSSVNQEYVLISTPTRAGWLGDVVIKHLTPRKHHILTAF